MAKKAQRKASTAKSKAVTEVKAQAKAEDVVGLTGEKKLIALLRAAQSTTKDVASLTGTMREKIGYAKEHDHLHPGAFALIRRLYRMEPPALNSFMTHFDHYFVASGLQERADSAPSMGFGPGEDGKEQEEKGQGDEEQQQGSTVRPFPQQRAVAAE